MITQEFIEVAANKFNFIKPFFFGRKRSLDKITTVVLHWTGGASLTGSIKRLKKNRYGYHFLIDKEGKIYQGSALNKRVSHSGFSYGPNGKDVNDYSIGISFSMRGLLDNDVPEEFTDEMYESCAALIKNIKHSIPNLEFITGHHWVSPRRKIDPYTFDFLKLINLLDNSYKIWKTGYAPFPEGLRGNCKCLEYYPNGIDCKKSSGNCKGHGGHTYSERTLSKAVRNESFQSDLDTQ